MENPDKTQDTKISKSRIEALVDGIFAFAMTLLVTSLVVPPLTPAEASVQLPTKIIAMRPEFFSFVIAFFVLASFWLVHHRQFHFVKVVDSGIVRITLCILAFVVLMPFTTNVSGDYSSVRIAADLFHTNMFFLGSLFLIHWWYLVKNPSLTYRPISKPERVYGMRRSMVIPCIAALGFLVSVVDPSLSMAVYVLTIPAFILLERFSGAPRIGSE